MRSEFAKSCQIACNKRPGNEILAQRLESLEEVAKKLWFTVTEGSVVCSRRTLDPLDLPMCNARVTMPQLASSEEFERAEKLLNLRAALPQVLEDVREINMQTATIAEI